MSKRNKSKKVYPQQQSPSASQQQEDSEAIPKKNKSKPIHKATPKKKSKVSPPQSPKSPKKNPPKPKTQTQKNKDDKKKDFLPGQKYPIPQQDDGARAFYLSLYSQNHKSQMAKKYCLEYGLLEKSEALKVQKQLAKK